MTRFPANIGLLSLDRPLLQRIDAEIPYLASLPLNSNVLSTTGMATGMPFVERG